MENPSVLAADNVMTLVLPYWISDALRRNNLNTMDIFDYNKLRRILSVEDMAQFLCVVNGTYLADRPEGDRVGKLGAIVGFYGQFERSLLNTMTPDQKVEMNEVIKPLSYASVTIAAAHDRLVDPRVQSPSREKYHSVSVVDSRLIVITLQQGILNALEDRAYLLEYVSDYLKALYTNETVQAVASYPYQDMFAFYMEALEASV